MAYLTCAEGIAPNVEMQLRVHDSQVFLKKGPSVIVLAIRVETVFYRANHGVLCEIQQADLMLAHQLDISPN